jgi:hypothetical protein
MYELGNELVSWNCIKIRERVDRVRVRESSKSVWVVRGCTIGREQGRVAGGGGVRLGDTATSLFDGYSRAFYRETLTRLGARETRQ